MYNTELYGVLKNWAMYQPKYKLEWLCIQDVICLGLEPTHVERCKKFLTALREDDIVKKIKEEYFKEIKNV